MKCLLALFALLASLVLATTQENISNQKTVWSFSISDPEEYKENQIHNKKYTDNYLNGFGEQYLHENKKSAWNFPGSEQDLGFSGDSTNGYLNLQLSPHDYQHQGFNSDENKLQKNHKVGRETYEFKEIKVPVPHPYPVEVTKKVPVPYPVQYGIPLIQPRPVPVYRYKAVPFPKYVPYPVHKIVPVPFKVPVKVPYPVKVQYPVWKPYPVIVFKKVPVYIRKPIYIEEEVPYFVEQGNSKYGNNNELNNYRRRDHVSHYDYYH